MSYDDGRFFKKHPRNGVRSNGTHTPNGSYPVLGNPPLQLPENAPLFYIQESGKPVSSGVSPTPFLGSDAVFLKLRSSPLGAYAITSSF